MAEGRRRDADRAEMRGLQAALSAQRETIRLHPNWDSERLLAERKAERLEGRISDAQARRSPETWQMLERQNELFLRTVEHYPDALGPLQVFDPSRRCPKCGGKASVTWEPDRLKRVCRKCSFVWPELPLDAVEAPETEEVEPPEEPESL